tara:strand:+ start:30248 stop:31048 length:801 start_codon:yes stop_codon:yes gene_type:complete
MKGRAPGKRAAPGTLRRVFDVFAQSPYLRADVAQRIEEAFAPWKLEAHAIRQALRTFENALPANQEPQRPLIKRSDETLFLKQFIEACYLESVMPASHAFHSTISPEFEAWLQILVNVQQRAQAGFQMAGSTVQARTIPAIPARVVLARLRELGYRHALLLRQSARWGDALHFSYVNRVVKEISNEMIIASRLGLTSVDMEEMRMGSKWLPLRLVDSQVDEFSDLSDIYLPRYSERLSTDAVIPYELKRQYWAEHSDLRYGTNIDF